MKQWIRGSIMDNTEIDRLVAEKLMSFHIHTYGNVPDWLAYPIRDGEVNWLEPTIIPNYSSDTSAAWQVAETLEQRFECTVNIQIRPRRGGRDKVWTGERWEHKRYAVTVEGGELGYDNFNCSFTIYDHSSSVAICLAALKAVGVEVPESGAHR